RPPSTWATRWPMSCSGYTTCWAPTRSRMRPCWRLTAFAQIEGTPRSSSAAVARTLASMWPMPTTAWRTSAAPSWRSTSTFVTSPSTTWVSSWAARCTTLGSTSTPSTSIPRRTSSAPTAAPKRPRPRTRTCSPGRGGCSGRRSVRRIESGPGASGCWWSANDRPLFRVPVQALALAGHERREQGGGPDPPEEHEPDEEHLGRVGQAGGDAGGQPHRAEGGDRLEEEGVEGVGRQAQERQHRPRDEDHGEQRHREGLALGLGGDATPEQGDVGVAAQLAPDHEGEHGGGRHLDAAGGGAAAPADEHQRLRDEPALLAHRAVVERVEPGGAGRDAGEQAVEHRAAGVHGAERGGVGPLEGPDGEPADEDQAERGGDGQLGVEVPAPWLPRPAGDLYPHREAEAAHDDRGGHEEEHHRVVAERHEVVGAEPEPGVVERGDGVEGALPQRPAEAEVVGGG